MKNLIAILVLLLSISAFGQNGRWDLQGTTVQAQGGNLLPVYAIPGANVSFFACSSDVPSSCTTAAATFNGAGTACPSTAQVNLQGSLACTGKSDTAGNFGAWFAAGTYAYSLTVSGKRYGPFMFSVGGGSGGSGTVTHTVGALTAGSMVIGNGGGDIKIAPIDYGISTPNTLTINAPMVIADTSGGNGTFSVNNDSVSGSAFIIDATAGTGNSWIEEATGTTALPFRGVIFEDQTAGNITLLLSSSSSSHGFASMLSQGVFGWYAGSSPVSTVIDTGISRDSAGVVDIGNGTAGNASGGLKTAAITDSGLTPGQCVQAITAGLLATTGQACGGLSNFGAGNLAPLFTTNVSAPTSNPGLTFTASTAAQNSFLAGPSTGGTGAYSFRAIVAADIPTLNQSTSGNAATSTLAVSANNLVGSASASFTLGSTAQVGTGATVVCQTGHICDSSSGEILLTSGTGSPTAGVILTVTLGTTRTNSASCTVTTSGSATYLGTSWTDSTTNFVLSTAAGFAASTPYTINYVCGGK